MRLIAAIVLLLSFMASPGAVRASSMSDCTMESAGMMTQDDDSNHESKGSCMQDCLLICAPAALPGAGTDLLVMSPAAAPAAIAREDVHPSFSPGAVDPPPRSAQA